ncbi:MAG: hypothetical protein MUO35_11235 [Anaerolineales bacterium]|nr:hypothetical protein [Anaerolineales bacterium]
MKIRAQDIRTALLAAGLIAGAWGLRDGIPWMVIGGVFLLGGALAWDGAQAVSLSPWRSPGSSPPDSTGLRLWQTASAALEIAGGAALLALALTATISGWERMAAYLGQHPGWLAIAAGLAMARSGLGVTVAPQPSATRTSQRLRNLLERLTGLPSLATGAGLMLAGGYQVLFPGAITRWIQGLLGGAVP